MLCKIADLIVEIPETGGIAPRLRDYRLQESAEPQIVINDALYRPAAWPSASFEDTVYMESGFQFYYRLLRHDGMMLHASAVEKDGMAYLFSGPCGMGKSTHTRIWQETFGESVRLFNDDKPALRRVDGRWYAYGTPWSGKHGLNINMKVPLAGICFLQRGQENRIRRLDNREAVANIISQTTRRAVKQETVLLLLAQVDRLVREIPVFELENLPEPAAAMLSHDTMLHAAKEAGL